MNLELVMIIFGDENAAADAYVIVRKVAHGRHDRDPGRGDGREAARRHVPDPPCPGCWLTRRRPDRPHRRPLGSIVGIIAGGVIGAASASLIDLGFPREDLQALRDQLTPGSSALIVPLEPICHDKLDAALASSVGISTWRILRPASAPDPAATREAIAEMRKAIVDP